ncbi:10404_t:CDS:1 [Cetraspora pellucida]|uniref:10404_t:CDS:1 n=1 Tax=Cetraspora pellucida TaxID=1433469 RepID=A0A9N9FUS3_9GLOM|nr:10404_t:CDS:1 [Cetraspora pellucida]
MACLPSDCLYNVFSFLQNDKVALRASILVNRQWCEYAIKHLWKEPFRLVLALKENVDYNVRDRAKTGMLIEMLIISLINNENRSKNNILQTSRKLTLIPIPIFNYVAFIRKIDLQDLGLAMIEWYEYICSKKSDRQTESIKVRNAIFGTLLQRRVTRSATTKPYIEDKCFIKEITAKICKLLMIQISRLDSISIESASGSPRVKLSEILEAHFEESSQFFEITNDYMGIISYPGANNCLSHIVDFSWRDLCPRAIQFVRDLPLVAKNLKRIVLDIRSRTFAEESTLAMAALYTLIEAQNALREFELYNFCINGPDLINVLKQQKDTLNRLVFKNLNVTKLDYISEIGCLVNLEELEILGGNLESKESWPICITNFQNLKFYHVDNIFPSSIKTMSNLIDRTLCSTLGSFKYIQRKKYCLQSTTSILETVSQYCTNLRNFECDAEIGSTDQLMSILTSSPFLETIIIRNKRIPSNLDDLLRHVKLTKLRYVELEGPWKFSPKALNVFLRRSKPPLYTFVLINSKCFEDDHLEVLLKRLSGTLYKVVLSGMYKRLSLDLRKRTRQVVDDFYYKTMDVV